MPKIFSSPRTSFARSMVLEQRAPRAQEGADTVRLPALHMDRAEPAGPQDLGDASRVVAIRLVAHGREGRIDLPRFHADNIETPVPKSEVELLAHRPRFETDPGHRIGEIRQGVGNRFNFTGQLTLEADRSLLVDDAQRAAAQRHVQSSIVIHQSLPSFGSFDPNGSSTSPVRQPNYRCFEPEAGKKVNARWTWKKR